MQRDEICSGNRLRLEAANKRLAEIQASRRVLVQSEQTLINEIETLSNKIQLLAKVGELFRGLMDRMVVSHVRSIESVVTEALKVIFEDQNLSFEAEINHRHNKVAIDFFLRQESEKMEVRAHPLEAFGGGPTSIASLVLKILAMRRLQKFPFLLMDETLVAVSDEYIDQTGLFLKKLAAKTGFDLLLITHKTTFLEHADSSYVASSRKTEGHPATTIQQNGDRHAK